MNGGEKKGPRYNNKKPERAAGGSREKPRALP